jgi:hypothetical protein
VCLGVRRPANPFNFEQASLIRRKAPPAGHKTASRAIAGSGAHSIAPKALSRRGYLSLLARACSLLGCRQRPDSSHEPAYCWNDAVLPESIPGFRLDSDRKKTRDLRLGLAALVSVLRRSRLVDTRRGELVAFHSDFDRLGQAIRLAPAEFWDQRGVRYCELSLATA